MTYIIESGVDPVRMKIYFVFFFCYFSNSGIVSEYTLSMWLFPERTNVNIIMFVDKTRRER